MKLPQTALGSCRRTLQCLSLSLPIYGLVKPKTNSENLTAHLTKDLQSVHVMNSCMVYVMYI